MPNIVFFATERLQESVAFYRSTFGAEIWLKQPDCTILKLDNLLLGVCQRETADTDGIITIVVDSREEVDRYHERFSPLAEGEPTANDHYQIYHFYLNDPEGRSVEVQSFDHETDPV